MSYILTYVRVALATSGVQSILEIPATDEIHMEDRNHGHSARNTVNRLARRQLHLNHVVSERTKGGINLYIELEKHKLDRIYASNIRRSLDKRTRTNIISVLSYPNIISVHIHTVNQTAGPGVTIYDASKQHIHGWIRG